MRHPVVIIGGGPAGLIAAEILAQAGHAVHVYERKPSLARKFLMAGRGGLNLTHSEPIDNFLMRYGAAQSFLTPLIQQFTPDDLKRWCEELGQETFIGTSGRVFPKAMKASPLLRGWLARLESLGVTFYLHHTWLGWAEDSSLVFRDSHGARIIVESSATLLALGGASWPSLGSDGSWTGILSSKDVPITPLRPANCGFAIAWSDIFKNKFAGQPLKNITLCINDQKVAGEIMMAQNGIEGGAVYALSSHIREAIAGQGQAIVTLDLRPDQSADEIERRLMKNPQARQSLSSYLKKSLNLSPVAISLLRETHKEAASLSPHELARHIKAVPLTATAPFDINRAISSAGGVALDAINSHMMLKKMPGVFVAGEMLDWEAPTGGYLLQACFATGVAAGRGMEQYFAH